MDTVKDTPTAARYRARVTDAGPDEIERDIEKLQRRRSRRLLVTLALVLGVPALLAMGIYLAMLRMPGASHRGTLEPLSAREAATAEWLRRDVGKLAGEIGERNHRRPEALARAATFIEARLAKLGFAVERQGFDAQGQRFDNLVTEIAGSSEKDEIVVVGAHYDSAEGTPAANDNGTGVAALLAIAELMAGAKPLRTLRFVAFVNEEPPHFKTEAMGSLHHARRCKERGERVVAMLSLETMGYYRDEPGTQKYPAPLSAFYPDTGNFIGFVGNVASGGLVRDVVESFRKHARFPSEGAALPGAIPGVGWSDHWSFWEQGYPGVMVTDTAPFRYPHYHQPEDTPDKVDYERLARVVAGLERVIAELAGA